MIRRNDHLTGNAPLGAGAVHHINRDRLHRSKHWLIRAVREAGLSIRFDEHVAANIAQRLLNPSLRVIGGSLIEIR